MAFARRLARTLVALAASASLALLAGCASTHDRPTAPSSATGSRTLAQPTNGAIPRPAHIIVVIMENHSYSKVIGDPAAPFINSLADSGALFTRSYAVAHPSQPNYLALFSGSTQGLTNDSCPHDFHGPNLAAQLLGAGYTFVGYSEGLPRPGFTGCSSDDYARKHAPWANFPALPATVNQPFTAFPRDFAQLPTVAFVIPNLQHDMHNGTVAEGDAWLRHNLGAYAQWAVTHNSLLVLTWDEDDHSEDNQIPTIIVGDHVNAGRYTERLTHYRLLRTLQACEGLPPIGASATSTPITDIWVGEK